MAYQLEGCNQRHKISRYAIRILKIRMRHKGKGQNTNIRR